MRIRNVLLGPIIVLMLFASIALAFSDDFEDGVIDPGLWLVGGAARGWHADQPIGTGQWQYSLQEIVASPDGYFQAHVWGPESANTFGAEAWIRTLHNYNDGKNYVINFTWEPGFLDPHSNGYFIQVTDGYIANPGNYYWMAGSMWPYDTTDPYLAGTTDFLWTPGTPPYCGVYFDNVRSIGKVSWSLEINSLGTACLYDGPDASGSIVHVGTLDLSRPWYIRLMLHDGTSAGYPAGDAWLNLYDFSATSALPDPATVNIDPDTLSLKSTGKWITAYIELPDGYDVHDIDVDSVSLEGLFDVQRSDIQGSVLMVKFDRDDLNTYLKGVTPPADVDLVVTGELNDGTQFRGDDTIRVIR